MEINDIVVLENEERYTLLEEAVENAEKYFLAAEISVDEEINYKKLVLLKVTREEDGDYVELVTNHDLIKKLSNKIIENKN